MNEFRRARRRQVPDHVQVIDTMTDEVLGRIGNLSETGMLLMAHGPGVDDGLYQVRFQLTARGGVVHSLDVGAHQLWAEPNRSGGSILDSANPIDLMNKIRRGTAMDDATPPGDAIDAALRDYHQQSGSTAVKPGSASSLVKPAQ